MRILRLDFRDELDSLNLHPLVTVVQSLGPDEQRQLFEAVRRLAGGSTVGLRGLVEHQGLLVELEADSGNQFSNVVTGADVLVYLDAETNNSGLIGLQAEIDQCERQAVMDAVAVEEVRADLDLGAKSTAVSLLYRSDPDLVPPSAQDSKELRRSSIQQAYEVVTSTERVLVDREILDLIKRWEEYVEESERNKTLIDDLTGKVTEAEARLERSTRTLASAEEAAQPVRLTSEEEARLELLADPAADPSRKGRLKNKLSEEEEEEMKALLGKVGVESWTAYSMFRFSPMVSPDSLVALDAAKTEFASATEELSKAKESLESAPALGAMRETHEGIKIDARKYLGALVPADVGAALAEQVDESENPEWGLAVRHLRDVLASNDLRPPVGLDPEDVVGWTATWLDAPESSQGDGRGRADRRFAPEETGNAEELEGKLVASKQSLARHHRALTKIGRLEQAAARSATRLGELKRHLAARADGVGVSSAGEVVALVKPVAEQVLADVGSSVPIVIVGSMAELSSDQVEAVMTSLERLAEHVQIIVVTASESAAGWAGEAGLERAALAAGTEALL